MAAAVYDLTGGSEKHDDGLAWVDRFESVVEDIFGERQKQRKLYPDAEDDKNDAADWAVYILRYMTEALRLHGENGEEVETENFRENMVKAATLCVAAIEAYDRTEGGMVNGSE